MAPPKPKPSSSKAKDKGKAIATPSRYSPKSAYSKYFFEFENEALFEKYITCGFIVERAVKLESFRGVGVEQIICERG